MSASFSSPSPSPPSPSLLFTPSELSAAALLTSAWRYEGWLSSFPLNRATVLDYFKHSPFYSFSANNEAALSSPQQLRALEGVEFEVEPQHSDALFFLIRKQWRSSPSTTHLLQLFYVVGVEPTAAVPPPSSSSAAPLPSSPPLPRGSVVPLPSFSAVARCALQSAFTHLNAAVQLLLHEGAEAEEEVDGQEEGRPMVAEVTEKSLPSPTARASPLLALADDALRRTMASAAAHTDGRGRGAVHAQPT